MKKQIKLNVNGVEYEVWIRPHWTLLDVLKEGKGGDLLKNNYVRKAYLGL